MKIERNVALEKCIDAAILASMSLLAVLFIIVIVRYMRRQRAANVPESGLSSPEAASDDHLYQ